MRPHMPDTTSSTPKIARRSNLLLVLAAISVTFMLFYPHLVSAQDNSDSSVQSCSGATVVETFQGNTTQDTPGFEINSENWQVVVDTESSGEFSFTSVDVVESQSFSTIATQDFDNGTDGVIDVQGSGNYNLSILTELQPYDITVQECGGSAGGEDPIEDEDVDNGVTNDQYEDGATTPATGGPSLSVLAAALLWFGIGGVLVARRFA